MNIRKPDIQMPNTFDFQTNKMNNLDQNLIGRHLVFFIVEPVQFIFCYPGLPNVFQHPKNQLNPFCCWNIYIIKIWSWLVRI
jgi:hypothetical protein